MPLCICFLFLRFFRRVFMMVVELMFYCASAQGMSITEGTGIELDNAGSGSGPLIRECSEQA